MVTKRRATCQGLAALGSLLLWSPQAAESAAAVAQLSAREFARRAAEPGVIIMDVRTARELKGGRIRGALHLDIAAPDFEDKLARLDRKATYLIYCASGARSARACQQMKALGFAQVFNLDRGLLAWQTARLPLEK